MYSRTVRATELQSTRKQLDHLDMPFYMFEVVYSHKVIIVTDVWRAMATMAMMQYVTKHVLTVTVETQNLTNRPMLSSLSPSGQSMEAS